ncbi:M56 family metallopeptidase [Paenibacillus jilunlii]|uniref:BlaR1 peptidase M56 n=1 Tax=Paenibacillus jilunlii TaxID=682956 RepID=A0A1G9X7L2_9BACL|nr:BlaR1 peptidase M56 [Paenibacillus jilunlii]
MTAWFTAILNMSITASYVAVAVMIVRLFLRRVPKIFSYTLWAVVLIRLVLPFSFSSGFSFLSFLAPNVLTGSGAMEYVPGVIVQCTTRQLTLGRTSSIKRSMLLCPRPLLPQA